MVPHASSIIREASAALLRRVGDPDSSLVRGQAAGVDPDHGDAAPREEVGGSGEHWVFGFGRGGLVLEPVVAAPLVESRRQDAGLGCEDDGETGQVDVLVEGEEPWLREPVAAWRARAEARYRSQMTIWPAASRGRISVSRWYLSAATRHASGCPVTSLTKLRASAPMGPEDGSAVA
jgi:hypothetical protein